ncbi:MAG: TIM barrel protein, partial [Candidatus Poribacteria bacterium]|nr:TIM barrel protein [Candidatus Poribacteria bacterium]
GVWVNPSEGVSREASLDALADNLSQMIDPCRENGMKIALEFEKGCPLDNYSEGIQFIADTGLPVYLTCDTYHLFNDGAEPHAAAHAMTACLGDVHVSGSNRGEPGGGVFDFETFAQGLKEIRFSGPLVVQYKMEDVASIARSCEFTQKFRAMIQA